MNLVEKKLKYLKILGLYICIDKNSFIIARFLLFRTKPFNLHSSPHNKYLRIFPGKFVKVLRVMYILSKVFLLKHNNYNSSDELIEVPYDGHILLKKTGGYKVFNLQENTVATQYETDIDADGFESIASNLKLIANLGISPVIKGIDYSNKCVYEEYHNLYKANRFYPISTYFYEEILPLWERNIEVYPKMNIKLEEYISDQESFLLENLIILEQDTHNKEIDSIREYAKLVINRIRTMGSQSDIQLNLSHGDLHAWNILLNKKNGIIIDWDTFKERTVFHDLFYMMFHNLFGMETKNYSKFISQLDEVISNRIKLQVNGKGNVNDKYDIYRLLYYLEYINLFIEKKVNIYSKKERIQSVIRKLHKDVLVLKEVENVIQKSSVAK